MGHRDKTYFATCTDVDYWRKSPGTTLAQAKRDATREFDRPAYRNTTIMVGVVKEWNQRDVPRPAILATKLEGSKWLSISDGVELACTRSR